jgi:hypothetical protein
MIHRSWRILPLLVLVGCGSVVPPQGEVTGIVTYRGQPLPGGILNLISDRGLPSTAVIGADGRYQVKAPLGLTRIGVDNRMLAPTPVQPVGPRLRRPGEAEPVAPTLSGTYWALPQKYYQPDTTGLTCTVQRGKQTADFNLDD